jgi:hypothetical protein
MALIPRQARLATASDDGRVSLAWAQSIEAAADKALQNGSARAAQEEGRPAIIVRLSYGSVDAEALQRTEVARRQLIEAEVREAYRQVGWTDVKVRWESMELVLVE